MIDRLPVTIALSSMLATATGFPVGRGRMPAGITKPPYYVLYSITATTSGAPMSDLNEDAAFVYQVTSVSGPAPARPNSIGTSDQTELMADRARKAILGRDPVTGLWLHPLVVTGAKVYGRSPDDTEPGGTSEPNDAIMNYVQRFKLDLTTT